MKRKGVHKKAGPDGPADEGCLRWRLVPPRKQIEEIEQRSDERRHVGQSGSVERLVHTGHFIAIENTEFDQLRFRTPARVEFHRQRDQLEK